MKTISRYIMTLALLLTAVTGAWADGIVCTASDLGKVLCTDGSIYENVSAATTAGKTAATVIAYVDETNKNGLAIALADESETMDWSTAKSTCEGKTAIMGAKWCLPSQDQLKQMFKANGGIEDSYTGLNTIITTAGGTILQDMGMYWSSSEAESGVSAWYVYLAGMANWSSEGEGYYYQARACLAFDIAASTIDVTPVTGKTNEWTFSMPAFDVEIAPIYAPVAQWAKVENVDQLPTAAEGIYAESLDSIITPGKVAKIGETENPQGIVMYAVTSTNQATAPALSAFSATLPTAKDITAAGDVLVWYYIKGADTPEGETATAENTFNDSEICPEPIEVKILSNKFNIQFKAANDNTIEAGKATVTVGGTAATVTEGKLEGVKMGSEVKVKAKDGYKFRKVEAKKGGPKTITIEDVVLVYEDGDTWEKIKDRNPGKVECNTYVFIKSSVLLLNGSPVSQTAVIVPDGTYTLGLS